MKRQCGDCTECCFHLAVTEINKEQGEQCEHCSGIGCKIYDQRPSVCREFDCAWVASTVFLSEGLRPKESGILLHFSPSVMGATLYIREIREGAFLEHTDLISELVERGPAIQVRGTDATGIATCPPDHPSHYMISSPPPTLKNKSLKVLQGDY
jgi:hypothetical protein